VTDPETKRGRGRPKGSQGTKRVLRLPKDVLEKGLEAKLVKEDGSDGCWVFQGTPTPTGHANFYLNGRIQGSAHRVAYEVWNGTIPPRGFILQGCGNKLCCRPEHLYLATPEEVARIRGKQGRSITGARNPKAKLTREQVDEIRKRALNKEPLKLLSEEFGVSAPTISQIKNGTIWRD
jgi:hypothetical protein